MIKIKRVFSTLIVFILCFYCLATVFVMADSNGIGTVQDTYSRTIVPGATYTYTESNNGSPQKNYVLEYNPKDTQVEALAVYGKYAFGGDTLSTNIALAESKGYTVIAGVNGSPFDTSNGVTIGTLISDGRIISASEGESGYDSFAIKKDGSMFISTSNLELKYTSNGKTVNIAHINKQKKVANDYVYLITSDYYSDTTTLAESTEVVLNIKSGRASIGEQMVATVESINNNVKRTKVEEGKVVLVGPNITALGDLKVGAEVTFDFINKDTEYNWNEVEQSVCGFYEILKDGNPVNSSSSEVHPRTTIGFKADGTIVFFVVDGRQPGFSIGLTDLACAQYMKSLGCVAAVRMDGGGSSTMGLRLPGDSKMTTINRPSDGMERSDADALLLVLKSDYDQTVGSDTILHAYPNKVALLQNTVIDFTVKATDSKYNPKTTPSYALSVEGEVGTITEDNKFKAKEGVGSGKVKISSSDASTYVDVKVTNEVDELYANVNSLALAPGEQVQLSVKAYNDDSLLVCSNESFTWTCSKTIGSVDKNGVFTATSNADVSGDITVSYGTVKATIKVGIGKLPQEITGFERDTCGTGTGKWQNAHMGAGSAKVSINTDLEYVRFGQKSLRVDFNLAGTTGTVGAQISKGSNIVIDGTPTAIGMWVYAMPSAYGAWIRMQYSEKGSTAAKYADFGHIDWTGWKYLEAPIEEGLKFPISVKYLVRIMAVEENERLDGTIFVDQLRAIYGFKNDDYDRPVISNLVPYENSVVTTTTQTISCDITDIGSGINKESTKFYLDSKKIDNILYEDIEGGYRMSWTPSSLIPLNKGKHTIKIRVEDVFGNFAYKEFVIIVDDKMPEFKFEGSDFAMSNTNSELVFTSSNNSFTEYDLMLKFNIEEVEIVSVEAVGDYTLTSENCEGNCLNLHVVNQSISSIPGSIKITYKTLIEGEVTIEVSSFAFNHKSYKDVDIEQYFGNLVIQSIPSYDFAEFITYVDKLNEQKIMLTISEFRWCLNELDEFNREYVSDSQVLDRLAKLDRCIEAYESILNNLDSVDSDASKVGSLLGGK